jgi:hypothetical protein
MYLWPQTLEVPILDPTKYVFAWFSTFIDHWIVNSMISLTKLIGICRAFKRPVGILNVKVVRAMKLRKKDILGASDPYVKLKLTEDKLPSKKTKVRHSNLNPEWNEEFHMVVKDPESQALELIVYDWEQVCFLRFVFVWLNS